MVKSVKKNAPRKRRNATNTLHEERETGMDGPGDELDQLHGGDVPGEDVVNILFLEMEIFYLFHQRYF